MFFPIKIILAVLLIVQHSTIVAQPQKYITKYNFDDILNAVYYNTVPTKVDTKKFILKQQYKTSFGKNGIEKKFPVVVQYMSESIVLLKAPLSDNKSELEDLKNDLNTFFKSSGACNRMLNSVVLSYSATSKAYSDVYTEDDFGISFILSYNKKTKLIELSVTKMMLKDKILIKPSLIEVEIPQKSNEKVATKPKKENTKTSKVTQPKTIPKEITLDSLLKIANKTITKNVKEPFKKLKLNQSGNIFIMDEITHKECVYKVKGAFAVAINNAADEIVIQVTKPTTYENVGINTSPITTLSQKLGVDYIELMNENDNVVSRYKNVNITQSIFDRNETEWALLIFIRPRTSSEY